MSVALESWKCNVKRDFYTVKTLCQAIADGYKKTHGGIVLDPIYQREYKFSVKKESSIIESLLLEIPIPVIYLSKDTSQETVLLNVIDGMHRLTSIYRYINDEYSLKGLEILKNLNGKKFSQLPANYRNKLELDSQVYVESIDVSGNEELEYEVFLRFNQETNPLTKQELNEVMYRSEYSHWFKGYVAEVLAKDQRFIKLFNSSEKKLRDKTINYNLYVALAYSDMGLVPGKNDTPYYISRFMKKMQRLELGEELEVAKEKTIEYLEDFIQFYEELSKSENIEHVFSKEFITKEVPLGNHYFLVSYLIPLVLTFDYIKLNGLINNVPYHTLYNAILTGMINVGFGDFGGVSSTSYPVQKGCIESIKAQINQII
jgi:Protein of unknown function DUF262